MSKNYPIYQVDSFTSVPFKGNPAGVCLLDKYPDDKTMLAIAAEMNISETAFVVPEDKKDHMSSSVFSLRWFSPEIEIPLCGHGTLASGKVLFDQCGNKSSEISFKTLSGDLRVKRDGSNMSMDFPLNPPEEAKPLEGLLDYLGIKKSVYSGFAPKLKKVLIHVDSEGIIRELKPDFTKLRTLNGIMSCVVTSIGTGKYDFISRNFAPWVGVNEDPVTGSAHTVLAPYWSRILGKTTMNAYQASQRGGEMVVRLTNSERVELIGDAIVVIEGTIVV